MNPSILAQDYVAILLQSCAAILVVILTGPVLFILGWNVVRQSTSRIGRTPNCARCNYNLTGVASMICPEWGTVCNEQTVVHGEPTTSIAVLLLGCMLCFVGGAVSVPALCAIGIALFVWFTH